ncbi:hypothetical protein ACWGJ2_30505, partial [Streptomyces sp. NPDC054796]
MSKRQKGRKHRTVNRTPRPRGAGRRTSGALPEQTGSAPPPRAQAPEPTAKASTAKAAATETEAGTSGGTGAGGDAAVFSGPARDGGLGRNAARTWERLEGSADGTTVDELCVSVGYTAPTIRKHLSGLAKHGMAEERDGRWYAAPDARPTPSEREPDVYKRQLQQRLKLRVDGELVDAPAATRDPEPAAPHRSARGFLDTGLVSAFLLAGFVSFYASADPDGLE